ncbi:hypothetical protein GBZ48_33615 [Azospirillum melinis]|uniref:Uncharacterized protein n=1 Tax=Azospirillum melinis TaxID=328839 RepID=A0ABX2KRM3_9PROT|nr:hypothetical protein [Azospirillum melinis]MBP2307794.1 hypothetical protein [Azospirillum melinis]NUB04151.1 hypothetical protein [Azospirillum melinis]
MVGIGNFNAPNFTMIGGKDLKSFMEKSVSEAKKKIAVDGNLEGFKAGFTSATGDISVKITSKLMVGSDGQSGYGLSYEMDTSENGTRIAHGEGVTGVTASNEDIERFHSMMADMNDASAAQSVKMTEEEHLNFVKENFTPDQYEKVVQGIKESKAAYEAQQRELRGEKGDASSPASGGGTRLDRMKARSEDAAQLAERLLKGVTGRDQSGSNGTAHWLASSLTDPATDKSSAQTADDASPPPSYKPVDLKT